MILYRSYGKTVEITKTQKNPSGLRRLSNTRKAGLPLSVRRIDSIRRTKRICLRRLLSAIAELGAPLFITLTFQGNASDVLYASDALSRFQRRLRVQFPNAHALFVPELSPAYERIENGKRVFRGLRIHFHGLLFAVPKEWGDVKKGKRTISVGREREERFFANMWGCGYVDMLQTDGSPKLGHYISKYVVKAGSDPFLTPLRLIRTTPNFPKPYEIRFEENEEEFEKWIIEKQKLRPVWSSETYTPYMGMVTKTFYDII